MAKGYGKLLLITALSVLFEVCSSMECFHQDAQGTMLEIKEAAEKTHNEGLPVLKNNQSTILCKSPSSFCFVFWLHKSNIIIKAGCWGNRDKQCDNEECVSYRPLTQDVPADTRFCCCKGPMCNTHVVNAENATFPNYEDDEYGKPFEELTGDTSSQQIVRSAKYETLVTVFIVLGCGCALVIVLYLVYRLGCLRHKDPGLNQTEFLLDKTEHGQHPASNAHLTLDSDHFTLIECIGRGSYGEVWLAEYFPKEENADAPRKPASKIALKLYTSNNAKQLLANEKDIYCLPGMDNISFPMLHGVIDGLNVQSHDFSPSTVGIALEYFYLGSLQSYLKKSSTDFTDMCRMAQSLAAGLAYLHNEITLHEGKVKPAVVHRDFNSRNILLRENLECVICDFGFAMSFREQDMRPGHVKDQTSLIHVGTSRYMAPEILDGSVNLNDCCMALKQIDVYSLGLVLWEISTRCHDFYQGAGAPEHKLPFQHELGANATFQQMHDFVFRDKKRPDFPEIWEKNSNYAIQALKQTIEDCWDQDAEARLTACCVEERLNELEGLWESQHKGLNLSTNFQTDRPVVHKKPELCNQSCDSQPSYPASAGTSAGTSTDFTVNSTSTADVQEVSGYTTQSLISTDTSNTDNEPAQSKPATQYPYEMYFSRRNERQPLPQNASNPVMERNTHKRSDEDLELQGNALLKKNEEDSAAVATAARPRPPSQADNTMPTGERRELAPRIPYLHNDVASEPVIVRPKQPNLPVYNKSSEKHKKANFLEWIRPKFKRAGARDKEEVDAEHGQRPQGSISERLESEEPRYAAINPSGAVAPTVRLCANGSVAGRAPSRPESLAVQPVAITREEEEDKCNLNRVRTVAAARDTNPREEHTDLNDAALSSTLEATSPKIMPSPFTADSEPLI